MSMEHLELVPLSSEHLLALIEGEEPFEACFGRPPAPGLRGFFTSEEVSPAWLLQLHASSGSDPWVHGLAIVHREGGAVIGTVGFKGPPDDDGVVEIAYGIVPAYEGRGYASEAVRAALDFALGHDAVRRVRAHTLPAENASTRVLRKCGFQKLGSFEDPEDGVVWRFERSRD